MPNEPSTPKRADTTEPGSPADLSAYLTAEGAPTPADPEAFAAYMGIVQKLIMDRRNGTFAELADGAKADADEDRAKIEALMDLLLVAVHGLIGPAKMPRHYPWDDRVTSAIRMLGAFESDGLR